MNEETMKTFKFRCAGGSVQLNGLAPMGLGIFGILGSTSSPIGLNRDEICAALAEEGVLSKAPNEANTISSLLSRLREAGFLRHPPVAGGHWRYEIDRANLPFDIELNY
jgi:hypothetical protein